MKRLALALSLVAAWPAAAFECHTALIFALDASDSVDPREATLQRRGIGYALRDPEVLSALVPSEGYGVALMAFEWSNPGRQHVIVPWATIATEEEALAYADRFDRVPDAYITGQTGVGAALEFAARAHDAAPAECGRRVVDVSGDGPGNVGATPDIYRRQGLFDRLTINGLVIRTAPPDYAAQQPTRDPLPYYEEKVRHGPGAFVMVTSSYDDYAEAMREKLLRELQPSLAGLLE